MTATTDKILAEARARLAEMDAEKVKLETIVELLERGPIAKKSAAKEPKVIKASKFVKTERWGTTMDLNVNVINEWLMDDDLTTEKLAKLIVDYSGVSRNSANNYTSFYVHHLLETKRVRKVKPGHYAKTEEKGSLSSLMGDDDDQA